LVGRWTGTRAALSLVVAAALTSCGGPSTAFKSQTALADDAITVASFNFPESDLLARIYARALTAGGYRVELETNLGTRELVDPALAVGLVEFVPEYAGTALQFLGLGARRPSSDPAATHNQLQRVLAGTNLVPLAPAPAQDANAIAVTRATAVRYALRDISDLDALASDLVFGGPPECPERPLCLPGLERVYGLRFRQFVPLDAGGPLTLEALVSERVDVGLFFTSDPGVTARGLVILEDDRRLQPAENVTPIVHRDVASRYLASLVDRVSRRLTTDTLRDLNGRVAAGEHPGRVAASWLASAGLA
jgi:osmoprotectant transport system substrate-binding protein